MLIKAVAHTFGVFPHFQFLRNKTHEKSKFAREFWENVKIRARIFWGKKSSAPQLPKCQKNDLRWKECITITKGVKNATGTEMSFLESFVNFFKE